VRLPLLLQCCLHLSQFLVLLLFLPFFFLFDFVEVFDEGTFGFGVDVGGRGRRRDGRGGGGGGWWWWRRRRGKRKALLLLLLLIGVRRRRRRRSSERIVFILLVVKWWWWRRKRVVLLLGRVQVRERRRRTMVGVSGRRGAAVWCVALRKRRRIVDCIYVCV